MMNGNPLQKKRPGDKFRFPAATFNTFIDTAIAVQRMQQTGGQREPRRFRLCRVVIEGPECEADFADHRYWVQEVAATDATFETWGTVGDDPFVAINLAELHADDVLQHHLVRDRQDIDDDSTSEYDADTAPVFVVVFSAANQWMFSAVRLDPIKRNFLNVSSINQETGEAAASWEELTIGIIGRQAIWEPEE